MWPETNPLRALDLDELHLFLSEAAHHYSYDDSIDLRVVGYLEFLDLRVLEHPELVSLREIIQALELWVVNDRGENWLHPDLAWQRIDALGPVPALPPRPRPLAPSVAKLAEELRRLAEEIEASR